MNSATLKLWGESVEIDSIRNHRPLGQLGVLVRFLLLRELLPVFANPASIVLTTSIDAHVGMPSTSIYAASKSRTSFVGQNDFVRTRRRKTTIACLKPPARLAASW